MSYSALKRIGLAFAFTFTFLFLISGFASASGRARLVIPGAPTFDFGSVPIGFTPARVLTVRNVGDRLARIVDVSQLEPPFSFVGGSYPGTGGTCGVTLAPSRSCDLIVSFAPTSESDFETRLEIEYVASKKLQLVTGINLVGNGGPTVVKQIAGGERSYCAIFSDGRLKCWGNNGAGRLGLGDTMNRGTSPSQLGANLPYVDLGTDRRAVAISVGTNYACAILDDGSLKCWGSNGAGQLGQGDEVARGDGPNEMGNNLPAINLGTGQQIRQVSAGQGMTCALLTSAKIKCWGSNFTGQLGLGDTNDRGDQPGEMGDALPIVDLGTNYQATSIVSTGAGHACAILTGGRLKCWGANGSGQLGLGDTMTRGDQPGEMGDALPFVDVGAGRSVISVALGSNSTCALLDNQQVRCWGSNQTGELGIGNTTSQGNDGAHPVSSVPFVDLGTGFSAKRIYGPVTEGHSFCALLKTDQIKCWGGNTFGELGQGDTNARGVAPGQLGDSLPPIALGTGRSVRTMAVANQSACALLDNFEVKCWGLNGDGQLALGNTTNRGDQTGEMGDALPFAELK